MRGPTKPLNPGHLSVVNGGVWPGTIHRAPKIDRAVRGVNLALRGWAAAAAVALLASSACTYTPRPAPVDVGVYWPSFLGTLSRSPFLAEQVSDQPPAVVWSRSLGSGIQGMPVVSDEVIIAASSDRNIHTLSRQDGSVFWRKRLEGPPISPLVISGIIYTATENKGRLYALRLDEGENVWRRRFPPVSRPILIAGDTLYAAAESGVLYALKPSPDDDPYWTATFSRPPSAGPLISGNWALYVAFDSLYLLDRFNGRRHAAAGSPEIFVGEAASDGEQIYLATERGSLLAWRAPDLELSWQVSGLGNFLSGPVLANRNGYAVTRDGRLIIFDLDDGSARVIARTGGTALAPPTVVQNGVLVGTLDGMLHFFTRQGDPIWKVDLEGSIETPVFVHEGRLIASLYGRVDGPLGSSPLRGKLVELR